MISVALALFLGVPPAVEPPRTQEPSATVLSSAPHKELSPATVERLERMSKMSGEQRSEALADLPAAQREHIQKGLERLDALSPDQRARWFNRYRMFEQMPAPKKEEVRHDVKDLVALSALRRKAVRQELETYRQMPKVARESRMRSADFRNKFNAEERQILRRWSVLISEPIAK